MRGPEVPESHAYLRDWLYQLIGESGVGMAGLLPLTRRAILDWRELSGIDPTPDEVDALRYLDHVYRSAVAEHAGKAIKPDANMPSMPNRPKV